jgi:hypothetical protein
VLHQKCGFDCYWQWVPALWLRQTEVPIYTCLLKTWPFAHLNCTWLWSVCSSSYFSCVMLDLPVLISNFLICSLVVAEVSKLSNDFSISPMILKHRGSYTRHSWFWSKYLWSSLPLCWFVTKGSIIFIWLFVHPFSWHVSRKSSSSCIGCPLAETYPFLRSEGKSFAALSTSARKFVFFGLLRKICM